MQRYGCRIALFNLYEVTRARTALFNLYEVTGYKPFP